MTDQSLTTEYTPLTEDGRKKDATTIFGFWVYLMTDFVLFASLFSVYAVLRANTFGSVSGADIFNLPFILVETFLLLTSSFTMGLSLVAARYGKKFYLLGGLLVTALLGVAFLVMELSEFRQLVLEGHDWTQSGFLSSYFVLVGTHGAHVFVGLMWMVSLAVVIARRGLTRPNLRKLVLMSLFWHFLDLVWIFIFTTVYLLGVV